MKLNKFEKEIISDFWKWVHSHEVDVEWRGDDLLMWVEAEDIRSFGEMFGIQDDYVLNCTLMSIDTFCIKVIDIMGGYGFGMDAVLKKEAPNE